MGVVLDDSPGERVLLYGADGSVLRKVVVDASGHLQVDALSSALPTGAATEAKQDTQITALQLIDDLRNALAAVATDKLRASVIDSALPTGAATEAKQDTQITALQLIDDLRNALAAVATDKLRTSVIDSALPSGAATESTLGTISTNLITELTRLCKLYGYDGAAWQSLLVESAANPNLRVRLYGAGNAVDIGQVNADALDATLYALLQRALLYGFNGSTWDRLRSDAAKHLYVNPFGVPGAERKSNLNAVAGSNYLTFMAVPSAKVYKVTNISAFDVNTAINDIYFNCVVGGTERVLAVKPAPPAVYGLNWTGEVYLAAGDYIIVAFGGCALNDDIYADIHYVVLDA